MIIIKLSLLSLVVLLNACAMMVPEQECPAGTQSLPDCPPLNAVDDPKINKLYELRTWVKSSELKIDPIQIGAEATIPVNSAGVKVIGPAISEAQDSLAAKIWMIENAQHTIDLTYYIFKRDFVGYAVLGALCNAVKRGVDVRIMVDSLGSIHPGHSELRALETCTEDAGFIRNKKGQVTTRRARAQVVIFNAITKFQFNRRSHDKLLIVDGFFDGSAMAMTGGRNISMDYYGINEDGSDDLSSFRDLEVLIKPGKNTGDEQRTIGNVSELYYGLLFLHKGNRRIWPVEADEDDVFNDSKYSDVYEAERKKSQHSLAQVKAMPAIAERMENMPSYMTNGFHDSKVRLSHQLSNLTSERVTTDVEENLKRNPNSIMYLFDKMGRYVKGQGVTSGTVRIVSPYLFSGKFYNEEGELIYDSAQATLDLMKKYPDLRLEVITNSVLTGDNIFTQAIIDIGMVPDYLLSPEMKQVWAKNTEDGELNEGVVGSEAWQKLINHPQIFIYQTGRSDSVILGGEVDYGKLHAKYFVGEERAFVGTSNFDYRSMLYNNEMGYFIESEEVNKDLIKVFEDLKAMSYRWGTPEWLEMRKKLMESDSGKGAVTEEQRTIYRGIRALGVEYLM